MDTKWPSACARSVPGCACSSSPGIPNTSPVARAARAPGTPSWPSHSPPTRSPGKSAKFLPTLRPLDGAGADVVCCGSEHIRMTIDRPRILVIENDPVYAAFARAALHESEDPPEEVLFATTLADGLHRIAQEPAVDLILLDLGLPDSGGLDTLVSVRD